MTNLPDFDAMYRGEPLMPGVERVPWNLGEPQPAIAALIDGGQVRSPVLDAGCGVGATTRALARLGHEVVGLDAAPTAIEQARAETAREGLDAEFAVADLTALSGYDGRFATVVDSAVFHALDADRRPAYVSGLARACRPGAVLHVLVFTPQNPTPSSGTEVNGVTEGQLRELVSAAFVVDEVEATTVTTVLPPEVVPDAPQDASGRPLLPALRLRAHLG